MAALAWLYYVWLRERVFMGLEKPVFRVLSKPVFEKPVLVEGLPGFGNVGRLAARLLIEFTRGEVFAESTFAKQVAEIEKGKRTPIIEVGNLNAVRDFTDVRDMVKGYYLAVIKGEPGEVYNICSGKGRKIKEVLDTLLKLSKVKNIKIQEDPARLRPSDVGVLIGSSAKFRHQTGWKPTIPFEKTMEDLLEYWRKHV